MPLVSATFLSRSMFLTMQIYAFLFETAKHLPKNLIFISKFRQIRGKNGHSVFEVIHLKRTFNVAVMSSLAP